MKKFFLDMLSNRNEVSAKRVSAVFVLINVVILTYIATFRSSNGVTPEFMYDSLCLIAGGGLGLTVLEKMIDLKYREKEETPPDPDQSI